MKIAFVYDLIYPFSKGGVEKRVRDLASQLAESGHEVHIYGTKQWDGPDIIESGGVLLHGVAGPLSIHGRSGARSIWQGLRVALGLTHRLLRDRYDVVDVQNMAPLACLATIAATKVKGSTTIVTWHEVWRDYWISYIGWKGYVGKLAEWIIAKWAPNHVAVSRTTLSQLRALGVEDARLIPNAVDCSTIEAVTPSSIAPDLLYVGRLVDHKNIDLLLDALTQLKLHGASPKTVIAGDGPERLRLETVAQTRGLDNVLFLGPVETDRSIYAIMKSAHVFVLPSMREGFGLAALEAAAAGLPIVTVDSRHNAALELVVGRTIGLVSPPTPIEFAAVLRRMIEDQALYTQLRDNALAVAREFDLPRVAFLAEGEYLSILNSKSAGEILLTPTG